MNNLFIVWCPYLNFLLCPGGTDCKSLLVIKNKIKKTTNKIVKNENLFRNRWFITSLNLPVATKPGQGDRRSTHTFWPITGRRCYLLFSHYHVVSSTPRGKLRVHYCGVRAFRWLTTKVVKYVPDKCIQVETSPVKKIHL